MSWDHVADTAMIRPGNGRVCRNEATRPKLKRRSKRWLKRFQRWKMRTAVAMAEREGISLLTVLDRERWGRYA